MFAIRIAFVTFLTIAATCDALVTSTVTTTATVTTTTTTTSISQTSTICASLLNATSVCRRRRQYWIDKPIIIALDEEMGDKLAQFFATPVFNPVIPSAVPVLERRAEITPPVGVPSLDTVQPSLFQPQYYTSRLAQPFFFMRWLNFLSIFTTVSTSTTTTTATRTATNTLFLTTATKTFIVSNCVPANLGYSTC